MSRQRPVLTQAPIHSSGELQRRVAEAGKTQQRQRTLGSGSARAGQQRCRTRRELARSAADAPRLALQYAQVQAAPGPIPTGFFSGSMTEAQLQCVTNCQNAQQQAQTDNQAFGAFPAWISRHACACADQRSIHFAIRQTGRPARTIASAARRRMQPSAAATSLLLRRPHARRTHRPPLSARPAGAPHVIRCIYTSRLTTEPRPSCPCSVASPRRGVMLSSRIAFAYYTRVSAASLMHSSGLWSAQSSGSGSAERARAARRREAHLIPDRSPQPTMRSFAVLAVVALASQVSNRAARARAGAPQARAPAEPAPAQCGARDSLAARRYFRAARVSAHAHTPMHCGCVALHAAAGARGGAAGRKLAWRALARACAFLTSPTQASARTLQSSACQQNAEQIQSVRRPAAHSAAQACKRRTG